MDPQTRFWLVVLGALLIVSACVVLHYEASLRSSIDLPYILPVV